ncbi:hypothetical protein [Sporosarcina cascadiensis]|uniref:hypothetical protein n=1 Tax=Sporosarcina cascadiensis TaxID=2660747 RepID=UPI0018915BCD|nr:hypothetical protein [Sporosarcina cascadiensis]
MGWSTGVAGKTTSKGISLDGRVIIKNHIKTKYIWRPVLIRCLIRFMWVLGSNETITTASFFGHHRYFNDL